MKEEYENKEFEFPTDLGEKIVPDDDHEKFREAQMIGFDNQKRALCNGVKSILLNPKVDNECQEYGPILLETKGMNGLYLGYTRTPSNERKLCFFESRTREVSDNNMRLPLATKNDDSMVSATIAQERGITTREQLYNKVSLAISVTYTKANTNKELHESMVK